MMLWNNKRLWPVFGAVLLSLVVAVLYGGTLQVPWYFDDYHSIVENAGIRNLGENLFSRLTAPRGLANFTFAINYHFGGLEVAGYHLVNIVIHLLTSLLVYDICRRIWSSRPLLSLGSALVFAAHPLQTQAVTYVVQRLTCLSGLFFFLAVSLFLAARKRRVAGASFVSTRHLLPYCSALLSGFLALAIKENAATLPLVLLLIGWLVPLEGCRQVVGRFLYVIPFFVAPVCLALKQVLLPVLAGTGLSTLGAAEALASSAMRQPEPLNYLFTEFSVYWLYLRLFFLPVGQALDYGYPVVTELWTPRTLLALSGLFCLFMASWRVRLSRPLVTLGVGWFFATLCVESTIIPLDPVYEHRMYVPIFGLVVALFDLLGSLHFLSMRRALGAGILIALSIVSWQRNSLWNDPVSFNEDNLKVAPRNERVMVNLARSYMSSGHTARAEALLCQALEINPSYVQTYETLSKIFVNRGEYHRALELLNRGRASSAMPEKLLVDLGVVLDLLGQTHEAERTLRHAIAVSPNNARGFDNLGVVLAGQRRWEEAIANYQNALAISPDRAVTHFNLGVALSNLGRIAEARAQFLRTIELNPRDSDALFSYGLLSAEVGDAVAARGVLAKLRQLDVPRSNELEAKIISSF